MGAEHAEVRNMSTFVWVLLIGMAPGVFVAISILYIEWQMWMRKQLLNWRKHKP